MTRWSPYSEPNTSLAHVNTFPTPFLSLPTLTDTDTFDLGYGNIHYFRSMFLWDAGRVAIKAVSKPGVATQDIAIYTDNRSDDGISPDISYNNFWNAVDMGITTTRTAQWGVHTFELPDLIFIPVRDHPDIYNLGAFNAYGRVYIGEYGCNTVEADDGTQPQIQYAWMKPGSNFQLFFLMPPPFVAYYVMNQNNYAWPPPPPVVPETTTTTTTTSSALTSERGRNAGLFTRI